MPIIDGKKIAEEVLTRLQTQPAPKQFLAAVLVGDDSSSESFLKQKAETAKKIGVDFRLYTFPETITQDELRAEVGKISTHKTCGGVIVQLPLPEHLDRHYICNAIPREKDVDVLGERALGAFYAGRNAVLPPAVATLEEVLQATSYKLQAKTVAVIGVGFLTGKPISAWLLGKAKEVLVFYRGSDYSLLKNADVVVTATGVPGLVKPEMLKENALVIDFGYALVNGKLVGDFDSSLLAPRSSLLTYTPTPGGTGPILVAKLFENFYKLTQA